MLLAVVELLAPLYWFDVGPVRPQGDPGFPTWHSSAEGSCNRNFLRCCPSRLALETWSMPDSPSSLIQERAVDRRVCCCWLLKSAQLKFQIVAIENYLNNGFHSNYNKQPGWAWLVVLFRRQQQMTIPAIIAQRRTAPTLPATAPNTGIFSPKILLCKSWSSAQRKKVLRKMLFLSFSSVLV